MSYSRTNALLNFMTAIGIAATLSGLTGCAGSTTFHDLRTDLTDTVAKISALQSRVDAVSTDAASRAKSTDSQLAELSAAIATLAQRADAITALQERTATVESMLPELRRQSTTAAASAQSAMDAIKHAQLQLADLALALERTANNSRTYAGRADDTDHAVADMRNALRQTTDKLARLELSVTQASIVGKEAMTTTRHLAVSTQSALDSMTRQINTAMDWLQSHSAQPLQPASSSSPAPQATLFQHSASQGKPKNAGGTTKPQAANSSTASHPKQDTSRQSTKNNGQPSPDSHATYDKALAAFNDERYPEAVQLFALYLSESTPNSNTPAALLKLATAMRRIRHPDAQDPLRTLVATYPNTQEAADARRLLDATDVE